MEAHLIAKRHQLGSIAALLNPPPQSRPSTPKKPINKPKNFTKANMKKLKHLEDDMRKKKECEDEKKKELENPPPAFKMKKFHKLNPK